MCVYIYIYIHIHPVLLQPGLEGALGDLKETAFAFLRFILRFLEKLFMRFILRGEPRAPRQVIVAIFNPFSQFCEIYISLLSLQTQPNTAPNLFQRGVEYGEYGLSEIHFEIPREIHGLRKNVILFLRNGAP